jgi:transposase
VAGISEAIAAEGAELLHLPPYSPDLNPIEQAFTKLKAALRKAAERTREALRYTHPPNPRSLPAPIMRNFFNQAGYAA